MPKVFISHSWDDNDISRKIAHDLKRDGAEIWIDYARISGGENLPERINQALEWCDTQVLVWSQSAATSKWVKKEWTSALSLDKRIIPCLIDDAKLPAILCSLLYIDFKKFDNGYNKLSHALKLDTLYEKKKAEAAKLKLEQERLKLQETEKKQQERSENLKFNWINQHTCFVTLLAISIVVRIYFITTFICLKQLKNQRVENIPALRSDSTSLPAEEVKVMIKKNDFFDSYDNKDGKGFDNQFETKIINGGTVVIDHVAGLMWQQGGSSDSMTYEEAKKWIQDLNHNKFAGFNNWRLPKLEEAMSLMEPKKMNENLYIDPKFDATQHQIWTADQVQGDPRRQWVVSFYGGLYHYDFWPCYHVRAVRFGQPSPK